MGTLGTSASAAGFLATLAKRSPFRIGRVFTLDGQPFVVDGEEVNSRAFGGRTPSSPNVFCAMRTMIC